MPNVDRSTAISTGAIYDAAQWILDKSVSYLAAVH